MDNEKSRTDAESDETRRQQAIVSEDRSGTFNVRLTRQLHTRLATEAEYEGVSLNQLVATRLAGTIRKDLQICPRHQCLMVAVEGTRDHKCPVDGCGWGLLDCSR